MFSTFCFFSFCFFFFFQAEDGIRDSSVTGVQTCALPIFASWAAAGRPWNGSGRFSRGWRQSTMPQASSALWEKFNRHAPDFEKRGCGILRSVAMRILVLGGDGMLGHQLLRQLGTRHEVHATL